MGIFGVYIHKSKTGQQYWLHMKDVKKTILYFFSKNPEDAIDVPKGYKVLENQKSGMPYLKKKASKNK